MGTRVQIQNSSNSVLICQDFTPSTSLSHKQAITHVARAFFVVPLCPPPSSPSLGSQRHMKTQVALVHAWACSLGLKLKLTAYSDKESYLAATTPLSSDLVLGYDLDPASTDDFRHLVAQATFPFPPLCASYDSHTRYVSTASLSLALALTISLSSPWPSPYPYTSL